MQPQRRDRRSVYFLARFVGLLVLFYFLVAWRPINDSIVEPFTAGIASVSALMLNAIGERVTVEGTAIRASSFAVNIENGCNGIETVFLFASAVLAFPAPWKRKVIGLLLGFVMIEALNFVRVVSLFWIGLRHPALFSSAHTVFWQSVVVLFGVLLFLLWATRQTPALTPVKQSRGRDA